MRIPFPGVFVDQKCNNFQVNDPSPGPHQTGSCLPFCRRTSDYAHTQTYKQIPHIQGWKVNQDVSGPCRQGPKGALRVVLGIITIPEPCSCQSSGKCCRCDMITNRLFQTDQEHGSTCERIHFNQRMDDNVYLI